MIAWISANWGTVAVSLILCAAVAGIIRQLYQNKKHGKSSCGCGCSHCAMNGSCHNK